MNSEIIELVSITAILLGLVAVGGSFAWLMKMMEPEEINLTSFCRIILCSASIGIFILLLGGIIILGLYADLLARR